MPDYWLWCENTVEVDLRLFAFKCTMFTHSKKDF